MRVLPHLIVRQRVARC